MKILAINSSLHGDGSTSRSLVTAYLDAARSAGDATIVEHDFATDPPPHLAGPAAAVIRGEPGIPPDQKADRSDALIAELEDADVLVLGVPMYNFGIPSTLKAWFDHVARARRTFSFEGGAPKGLLDPAKRVIVFVSSDGLYTSGPRRADGLRRAVSAHHPRVPRSHRCYRRAGGGAGLP